MKRDAIFLVIGYLGGSCEYLAEQSSYGLDDWEDGLETFITSANSNIQFRIQILLAISRWNSRNVKLSNKRPYINHFKFKEFLKSSMFTHDKELKEFAEHIGFEIVKSRMIEEVLLEDWERNKMSIKEELRKYLTDGRSPINLNLILKDMQNNPYYESFLSCNSDFLMPSSEMTTRLVFDGGFEDLWLEREQRWLIETFQKVKLSGRLWTPNMKCLLRGIREGSIGRQFNLISSIDSHDSMREGPKTYALVREVERKIYNKNENEGKRKSRNKIKGERCFKRLVNYISSLLRHFTFD